MFSGELDSPSLCVFLPLAFYSPEPAPRPGSPLPQQLISETSQIDEYVDDFCFTLALALRRLLGITLPSEGDEEDGEVNDEQ